MKHFYIFFLVFVLVTTGFSQTHFTANLTGDQGNPAITTDATGTGVFLLTSAGLEFTITVEGLDFTAAHFHNGTAGANGGVVRTITDDFTGKTASGIWTSSDAEALTPELIADLLAGNLYINVHTAANPGGEIRGQVNLSAGTGFSAKLDGNQQNPAVTTDATGTGFFVLTEAGLKFNITVEGLEFTAAHFHNGTAGANGGVVRTLTDDFTGKTASGIWTSSDSEALTSELIADLLAGNLYINVHTATNPGGEIRGQVNLSSGTAFSAKLDGSQLNPAVTTDATGTGLFTLTDAGLVFNVTVEGLDFTAAHLHRAAAGANGGVVRTLTDDFTGKTASGVWTNSDSEPLTPELIADLLAGNLYVNVHTAANPGGEIRGQVELNAGTSLSAKLDGNQLNPAVTTSATGSGTFVLTDAGLEFNITIEGVEFTAAHFHNGTTGANGGVVRTLTDDFTGQTASGIWTSSDSEPLTPELIADLLAGNLYVNVHTAANPGGEIRGQVYPKGGTGLSAKLDGNQQNPAVTTNATGAGVFNLTNAGLVFDITVEGLDFTAAHFHNAATGANGGVVRTLTDDFSGKTASGIWTSSDSEPLTPELIADLLAGNLYVNVHTAANPGGEIRGQVNLSAGIGFSASLDGNQQNPPVVTSATGTAAFTLTDAGLVFNATVEGLDFTASHFHNGAVGINGGVVRGITDDFSGKTAFGVWTSDDSQSLTRELIGELLNGGIYLNVHTSGNPPGEIRGQLGATDIISSVNRIDGADGIPQDFTLYQSFPNPFNPTTNIRFDLPSASNIKLSIYNNLGQLVSVLVNEELQAGQYNVLWNGRDFNGNIAASGLYFYQIKTGKLVKTARMVLIK